MIGVRSSGSFAKMEAFWDRVRSGKIYSKLDAYGREGVDALSSATPVDTGATSASWEYRIIKTNSRVGLEWFNTNQPNGVKIAVLLQYGHGTGTGGWVEGIDYVNPAMKPVFEKIAEQVWKEVTR